MAFYYNLKHLINDNKRQQVVNSLLSLIDQLNKEIPSKDLEDNLLLATWNIRDFARDFCNENRATMRRGYGPRLPESLYYIAEIISRFDLVAIQEVNELDELEIVMDILGYNWDYIATDIADTRAGGNGERMTFVYDKRKVNFENVAGEIVLPTSELISKVTYEERDNKIVGGKQFRRTPFIVSFRSGWVEFSLCTVHIYYGSDYGDKLNQRIEEIQRIAEYLGYKAEKEKEYKKSLILLGDFNIVHPEHKTMEALENNGFYIPKELKKRTNVNKDKYYDQIAFYDKSPILSYIKSIEKLESGVFDIFKNVFKDSQLDLYRNELSKTSNGEGFSTDNELKDYYKDWRTYQISDHQPLWVRLKINNTKEYLNSLING